MFTAWTLRESPLPKEEVFFPDSRSRLRFTGLPEGDKRDPEAYKTAIARLPKGSAVISMSYLLLILAFTDLGASTVFTPDSTHYPIAKLALESGHHVMVTKPATQLLEHHQELANLAAEKNLVCWVEQCVPDVYLKLQNRLLTSRCLYSHKRYDPAYSDAKMRSANIGDFSFFTSYMSQPKSQLETFRAWAGIDSDISYYLNSHHVSSLWRVCWKREMLSEGVTG